MTFILNTALTFSIRGCNFGVMFLKMGFSVKSDRADSSDMSDMSDRSDFDGDGGGRLLLDYFWENFWGDLDMGGFRGVGKIV